MKKELYEKIIRLCLNYGCDFAEVYFERSKAKTFALTDSKLDDIITSNRLGVGIRIAKNKDIYYASTNDLTEENIIKITKELLESIPNVKEQMRKKFKLNPFEIRKLTIKVPHDEFPHKKKVEMIKKIDTIIRKESPLITQVRVGLREDEKEFTVANSEGKYIESNEILTRIYAVPIASKDDKKEQTFQSLGAAKGYEILESFELEKFSKDLAQVAVSKLDAIQFEGGKVPVILAPGFGSVIFHEACGHGLEATSVADKLSVFSNELGKTIASNKVTLIDDGTIPNEWGTTIIDSEGNLTQKNILIENGVLKSFLVDNQNAIKMNLPSTASGRRQSYLYPPTSRMNNTYLAPGTDKVEDMFKSVKYGVYCKSMSGGSVDIKTGDFNFAADESYLIREGKISEMLTNVTLIGKGQEVLKNVEMVSNDLLLQTGYCGSSSGTIPVTIGQPTIKISEILVGGKSENDN